MTNSTKPHNGAWWNHESDRSQMAELSTAYAKLQREQHVTGWRRNATVALCVFAVLAALKFVLP